MSTNLILNENSNIKNDKCLHSFYNANNNKLFKYNFLPEVKESSDNMNIRGVLQSTHYDKSGSNIDASTKLRNGTLQDIEHHKKELDTRLFPGAPFMASGQSELKNTDLYSQLLFSENTRTKKSNNTTSDYSADNFIPMIPILKENVQNVDHIIPTYWINGGMSSRAVIRNINYLKSECKMKK